MEITLLTEVISQDDSFLDRATKAWNSSDHEMVISVAAQALAAGSPAIDWVRFALSCRDKGDTRLACQLLEETIHLQPGSEAAYYERAFLHRLSGEHREAKILLDRAASLQGASFRTYLFLAHMLHILGAHPEADAVLNNAPATTRENRYELDVMFAFGRYVSHFPLGRSLVLLDEIKKRYAWLETDEVAERVQAAIKTRSAFSLIRLGDGEGGTLCLSEEDEYHFRPLYERNRNDLISMWFGKSFDWENNQFLDTAQLILDDVGHCDIIGLPYEGWLLHEYKIASIRGIPSLVNIYRGIIKTLEHADFTCCSQHIHLDLYSCGHLDTIISMAREVSVIACLPEIADLLKNRFRLDQVMFYRIPGEQGSKHLLGDGVTYENHYPDAFNHLTHQLSRPQHGQLFLVAGGLLGKLYCKTIRNHGGIALDIGSLVDGWTGRATRPGYDQSLKL